MVSSISPYFLEVFTSLFLNILMIHKFEALDFFRFGQNEYLLRQIWALEERTG